MLMVRILLAGLGVCGAGFTAFRSLEGWLC